MDNQYKPPERVEFTKEMKRDYTILLPTMLPVHFKMIEQIFKSNGYNCVLLDNSGRELATKGLRYVHNDSCYPAIVVIGQFMDALSTGKYDPDKTALMITQTGGGCRASNYIALLRKALSRAGYPQIPVISLNASGLEKNSGFKLTLPMMLRMLCAVMYGDLMMMLGNKCRPYEVNAGETDALTEKWTARLSAELIESRFSYRHVKSNYSAIAAEFAAIKRTDEKKPKVGIVGEIFVKFSPLGNNNLEQFLLSENAEVVMPGLLDFLMYCIVNGIIDRELYGFNKQKAVFSDILYKITLKLQRDMFAAVDAGGVFEAPTHFDRTYTLTEGVISHGVKMGEGWLLTAEMLELIDEGVNNIICTQPFGCLPNHIAGKGMMKPIKDKYPNANIMAIDYDAGASRINQENRIKLMLSNAGIGGKSSDAQADTEQTAPVNAAK